MGSGNSLVPKGFCSLRPGVAVDAHVTACHLVLSRPARPVCCQKGCCFARPF